jgi:hypothetical protein
VTALTFNAVWQYARRHRLLSDALDPAGATAIGRRFQLALAWLTTGALLGAVLPVFGVVVIAAFNTFYWLPIRARVHARDPPEAWHVPAPSRPTDLILLDLLSDKEGVARDVVAEAGCRDRRSRCGAASCAYAGIRRRCAQN